MLVRDWSNCHVRDWGDVFRWYRGRGRGENGVTGITAFEVEVVDVDVTLGKDIVGVVNRL
jgi:hypothetical protein